MNQVDQDTIVAVATPRGKGGVGIIRVSGDRVLSIVDHLVEGDLLERQAKYTTFYDQFKQPLDMGIALLFKQPFSYTGEDVLEIQGHGGSVVMDMMVKAVVACGARIARPGEFSERAFLNDKMDLTQAEAVADLINASSEQAAKSALNSLLGSFSKTIEKLSGEIVQLRVYIESALDFSDEDIDFLSDFHVEEKLTRLIQSITEVYSAAKQGRILQEGLKVVIAGAPNAGKSTLLNQLSERDSAIVTPVPGTTRDVIREQIFIEGFPLHVVDTAGLRKTDETVEKIGVQKAMKEIAKADLILYLFDGKNDLSDDFLSVTGGIPLILLRNKCDLHGRCAGVDPENAGVLGSVCISISAKEGLGIDVLKQQILALTGCDSGEEGLILARRRHLDALHNAEKYLKLGREQLNENNAAELLAEDLRQAHQALGEITGEYGSDDLLGEIFSTFCIGK